MRCSCLPVCQQISGAAVCSIPWRSMRSLFRKEKNSSLPVLEVLKVLVPLAIRGIEGLPRYMQWLYNFLSIDAAETPPSGWCKHPTKSDIPLVILDVYFSLSYLDRSVPLFQFFKSRAVHSLQSSVNRRSFACSLSIIMKWGKLIGLAMLPALVHSFASTDSIQDAVSLYTSANVLLIPRFSGTSLIPNLGQAGPQGTINGMGHFQIHKSIQSNRLQALTECTPSSCPRWSMFFLQS